MSTAESETMSGAEQEVRAHSDRADDILSSITSIFIVLDNDGRVLQWNEAAEQVLGIPSANALCKDWRELDAGWDKAAIDDIVSRCHQDSRGTVHREVRIYTGTETRSFAFLASPLRRSMPVVRLGHLLIRQGRVSAEVVAKGLERQLMGDQRELGVILVTESGIGLAEVEAALEEQRRLQREKSEGVILLGVDLTERRALESQVAHYQKLEAIGQLAAGIAHEINTPTQFIGDNLRFLQDSFADLARLMGMYTEMFRIAAEGGVVAELNEEALKLAEEIDLEYLQQEIPTAIAQSIEGNTRIAGIVRAMKEFSHPGTDGFTTIDINHALESTLTVARNEYKYVADLKLELEPSLPAVSCLPGELNQVFLNLLINAAHAIEDKHAADGQMGTITLRTRQAGDFVEIEIEDTGSGIPEHIRDRIFDPFFTTKQVGKGTGQGLSIAHSVVVEKHRGTISVRSEVGAGTTFLIRLPIRQPEAEEDS